MAIGDKKNPNLFGTKNNKQAEESNAELAAQNAMMGAGGGTQFSNATAEGMPASSFGQAPEVSPFSMQAAEQVNPMMQEQSLAVTPQAPNPVTFLPYAGDVAPPPASALSVFTPGGEVKPGMDVNAITPSPEMTSPSAVNTALNQGVAVDTVNKPGPVDFFFGAPTPKQAQQTLETQPTSPSQRENLQAIIRGEERPSSVSKGFDYFFGRPDVPGDPNILRVEQETQEQQGTPNVDQVLKDGAGSVQPGEVDFAKPPTMPEAPKLGPELEIRRGEEGSSQRYFTDITDERPLTPEEIKLGKAFADRRGFDFNPETGFSVMDKPGSRKFDTPATRENFRNRGLTFTQFLRGENDPSQRTEEFVDPQGRLRRRFTSEAARLQEYSERDIAQNRPLAPEFAEDKAAGDKFMAKLRAQRTGEAKESDGEMSFSDAKRRAKGQLAARGIDGASASMVNDLARSIQDAEPERLEGLETEKAVKEARIKTAEAEQNKPEFAGRVYTVDGVTFAQTSRGGVQVISTGTEDPEKTTREAQKFEFTKKKIEDARKAYEEGDLTKSNDILAAANIQQYGIQANATQYFADSTPQVTPPAPPVTGSGLTQQQEDNITRQAFDTMGEAEAANLPKGTKITIGGRNATV